MTHPVFIDSFPHTRQFGLELEFFNLSQSQVKSLLVGAQVECYVDEDSEEEWCGDDECEGDCDICSGRNANWKITDDGSITGANSVELVSPILRGVEGLREVAKVVKILCDAGAKVNKSCGLHVHVDARDLAPKTLVNVYKRYALHETQIDAFMPASRRGNANTYCKSTHTAMRLLDQVTHSMSSEQIASRMEERWDGYSYAGGRYNKVNLCAYLRHGTVEFRHHAGTVNVDKVVNWIAFCVNFVEVSKDSETASIFTGVHSDSVEYFTRRAEQLS